MRNRGTRILRIMRASAQDLRSELHISSLYVEDMLVRCVMIDCPLLAYCASGPVPTLAILEQILAAS